MLAAPELAKTQDRRGIGRTAASPAWSRGSCSSAVSHRRTGRRRTEERCFRFRDVGLRGDRLRIVGPRQELGRALRCTVDGHNGTAWSVGGCALLWLRDRASGDRRRRGHGRGIHRGNALPEMHCRAQHGKDQGSGGGAGPPSARDLGPERGRGRERSIGERISQRLARAGSGQNSRQRRGAAEGGGIRP